MMRHQELLTALKLVGDRTMELILQPSPLYNPEMLWILFPLLAALFLMELYFGRYKKEELGWNTAVSNSLVLFFVGMNLCSFLYSKQMLVGFTSIESAVMDTAVRKSLLAFFIIIESIFLLVLNFFHIVSRRFAFGISSGMIMNFLGGIAIILVYSELPFLFDIITLPAILITFIFMVFFFWIIQILMPKAQDNEDEENDEEDEE